MRTKQLMIRVSDSEKEILDEIATKKGLATASWGRLELLRLARAELEERRFGLNVKLREAKGTPPLEILSLFCGPGGLDQGFRKAGFQTRLAIDTDIDCVATFALNHPGTIAARADISELKVKDLDKLAGRRIQPFGVLGGPPCQSFSVSNVFQKDEDPRNKLPETYARLLSRLNERHPISFFVFENVPGLLSKRHRQKYELFKNLFERAGFDLYEAKLNAMNYRIPQDRLRIFVIGINSKLYKNFEWVPPKSESGKLTVRDAIGGLPDPIYNAPGLDCREFPVHPNHWCLVPRSEKFKPGAVKMGAMAGRSFRRLTWDEPSWTVAYGHREVHIHPEGHRRLSIYEAMLLQSFPKDYRLTGNMTAQIRLVSEAVPPRLAWRIAQSIKRTLEI